MAHPGGALALRVGWLVLNSTVFLIVFYAFFVGCLASVFGGWVLVSVCWFLFYEIFFFVRFSGFELFFSESLILAQDERWRRA